VDLAAGLIVPTTADVVTALRAAGCVFAEEEAELLVEAADGPAHLDALVRRRVSGEPLEQLLATQLLQVVTPAGLELSWRAAQDCERQRAALDRHWRLRLERGRQDTDRAARQYHAVEPENRLVARTLERQWEEALSALRALEEEYDRFRQEQPLRLSAAERARIEALAHDLPAVWQSPQTSVTDKRQVMRLLVEQVVVWAPASSQQVKVHVHWAGGTVTEHQVRRPVRSWSQISDGAALLERVRQGRAAGRTSRQIAEELNAAGYRTPRGRLFTADNVRHLGQRLGRPRGKGRRKGKGR
jgi:hypothetical protein